MSNINILILSESSTNYSTKRLVEEIERKGHTSEIFNPSDLYAYVNSTTKGHDKIYKRGDEKSERLKSKDFDAIIPRIAGGLFEHGLMITRQLRNNMKIFSTSSPGGLRVCSNKLTTCQILSEHKIRVPKQILAHQPTDYKELIEMVGDFPCVAKLQKGSLGDGVMLLTDPLSASTSLRSFEKLGADVILQEFIDTGEPKNDIRIIVIGAETDEPKLFSYKRFALDDDFRSNYTKSKLGEKVEITEEEREMAIDASKILNLGVCGVDIMRDNNDDDKPYCLECNGNPGLLGIEKVTEENVAGAIIDYIIDNYKKGNKSGSISNKSMIYTQEGETIERNDIIINRLI